MKLKLDENLSRYLKPVLATEGHQVSTEADEGLLGKTDEDVAAAAAFVLDFVQKCNLEELAYAVVVVDPDRVRVRRKPIFE